MTAERLSQMVVVRMTPEEHEAIRQAAQDEDRTMAMIMRRAIRHYLNPTDVPDHG